MHIPRGLNPRPERKVTKSLRMSSPHRIRILRHKPQLALVLSLLSAVSTWFYVQRILVPHQLAEAAAHGRPRGNLSDLYPRWLGARELLLHHRDPYSAEITREVQIGSYRPPLHPTSPAA